MQNNDLMTRFMRLEEIKYPEDWIQANCKGLVIKDLGTIDISALTGPCHIVLPYSKFTFYELYDMFEDKGYNYKIYPIKEKSFWVIQID